MKDIKHKKIYKFYKSLRLWNFEVSITYNNALQQIIIWIGKRTYPRITGDRPIKYKSKLEEI